MKSDRCHRQGSVEARSSSALMRELLNLGLAQYVNIYYRTPQQAAGQQLESIFKSQLQDAAARGKAEPSGKNDV